MEKIKKQFLNRYNELYNSYKKMFHKEKMLMDEISMLNKAIIHEQSERNNIDADKLLNGFENEREMKLKSKVHKVVEELNKTREYIALIKAQGDLPSICKTDKQLEEYGLSLKEAMMKQAKEDEKIKRDLEKRYEKIISDIVQLDNERKDFIEDAEDKKKLFGMIMKNTEVDCNYLDFSKMYTFEKSHFYNHLGKIKDFH